MNLKKKKIKKGVDTKELLQLVTAMVNMLIALINLVIYIVRANK